VYKLFSLLSLIAISSSVFSDAEKLRDPTMPIGRQIASQNNAVAVVLHLNSVLISSQRRVAVINGQALRQGEEIKGSGFRVVSIKTNSVTVQSNNATRVLSLIDSKVKK
jgi:MSHA biogenesis protein MshK